VRCRAAYPRTVIAGSAQRDGVPVPSESSADRDWLRRFAPRNDSYIFHSKENCHCEFHTGLVADPLHEKTPAVTPAKVVNPSARFASGPEGLDRNALERVDPFRPRRVHGFRLSPE
jgi:hypothetical protein